MDAFHFSGRSRKYPVLNLVVDGKCNCSACDWLATYLKNYNGTMILVSHDVLLLESSVNSIAEVVSGGASKMLLPF
eukprot:8810035-Ditylum_brightwellii.AAC.1